MLYNLYIYHRNHRLPHAVNQLRFKSKLMLPIIIIIQSYQPVMKVL